MKKPLMPNGIFIQVLPIPKGNNQYSLAMRDRWKLINVEPYVNSYCNPTEDPIICVGG